MKEAGAGRGWDPHFQLGELFERLEDLERNGARMKRQWREPEQWNGT